MMFQTRQEAGKKLVAALSFFGRKDVVILAIPRGGVVVAAEIGKERSCPLDVIITRKLGAPGNPELAIGATTSKGGLVLDRELIEKLEITPEYLHKEHLEQIEEARRRERVFRGGRPEIDLIGKKVIIVDDGLATGATAEAAVKAVREKLPLKVVLAVPVAPYQTVERLRNQVDKLVCLAIPEPFYAIGEFYREFPQVSDEEVIQILQETNRIF